MLSTNQFDSHVDKFNLSRTKSQYWVPKYDEDNRIRIISGPVKKMAKFRPRPGEKEIEYEKQCMVVIERSTESIKILSAGKQMFKNICECIRKNGNLINYDISIKRTRIGFTGFPTHEVIPLLNEPLSEDDKFLIRNADIPDEFKVKKYYDYLIVVGAQFRITKESVMLANPNGLQENLFGPTYPPCEILYVDDDQVVIGRKDWDFNVPVSREAVRKKFAKGSWVPVKTLIENRTSPIYCGVHRKLLPKGFACCSLQMLTGTPPRVIF